MKLRTMMKILLKCQWFFGSFDLLFDYYFDLLIKTLLMQGGQSLPKDEVFLHLEQFINLSLVTGRIMLHIHLTF